MPPIHCQCDPGKSSGAILPINNDETMKQINFRLICFIGLLIFFTVALVVIYSSQAPGEMSACIRMSVTAAAFP
eukprot:scaffold427988_cov28-Prasinocladus_malaysianus.AAC.1